MTLSTPDDVIFALAREFCEAFAELGSGERTALVDGLDQRCVGVLLRFAWRCAEIALSEGKRELIRVGLIALLIAGSKGDTRDAVIVMAILYFSLRGVGGDADVFREVGGLLRETPVGREMEGFPGSAGADSSSGGVFRSGEARWGRGPV
jgi:hypothetical protein